MGFLGEHRQAQIILQADAQLGRRDAIIHTPAWQKRSRYALRFRFFSFGCFKIHFIHQLHQVLIIMQAFISGIENCSRGRLLHRITVTVTTTAGFQFVSGEAECESKDTERCWTCWTGHIADALFGPGTG